MKQIFLIKQFSKRKQIIRGATMNEDLVEAVYDLIIIYDEDNYTKNKKVQYY